MSAASDSGYFFLGIVAKSDLLKGRFEPSYVLCKSAGYSSKRSGLRVAKVDASLANSMPKLLVADISKHPEFVDFLSNYRTRDHMHGDKHYRHVSTLKYTPEGAIFWFPCSLSGVRAPRATPIFVKLIPEKGGKTDGGFERLKEAMAKTPTLLELLNNEPYGWLYPPSLVKPNNIQQHKTERKRRKTNEQHKS